MRSLICIFKCDAPNYAVYYAVLSVSLLVVLLKWV